MSSRALKGESALSKDDAKARLCDRIGHEFTDPALLREALTHRSAGTHNNERLEFLGDALLGAVVADELYRLRPQAPEGELSRLRAALVRRETLAEIARELELGELFSLGEGERKSGGHRRDSILSDGLEAVIGAVYLDSDFATVRALIARLFQERLANLPAADELKDPKTRLQEFLQQRGKAPPHYDVLATEGAEHARRFTVRCRVEDSDLECTASAGSRRRAEQQAARACLDALFLP